MNINTGVARLFSVDVVKYWFNSKIDEIPGFIFK